MIWHVIIWALGIGAIILIAIVAFTAYAFLSGEGKWNRGQKP